MKVIFIIMVSIINLWSFSFFDKKENIFLCESNLVYKTINKMFINDKFLSLNIKEEDLETKLIDIQVLEANKDINNYVCKGKYQIDYGNRFFYVTITYKTNELKKSQKPLRVTVYDFKSKYDSLFDLVKEYTNEIKEYLYMKKIGFNNLDEYEKYKKYKIQKKLVVSKKNVIKKVKLHISKVENLRSYLLQKQNEFTFDENKYIKALSFKKNQNQLVINLKNIQKYKIYYALLSLVILDDNLDTLKITKLEASNLSYTKDIVVDLPSHMKKNKVHKFKYHLVLNKISIENKRHGSIQSGEELSKKHDKIIKRYKLFDTKNLSKQKSTIHEYGKLVNKVNKLEKKYSPYEIIEKNLINNNK